jgi:hypothetical protein
MQTNSLSGRRAGNCDPELICTPASTSQEVGAALGAQAGEKRMREVAKQGGFSKVRLTSETPFNLVYEAKA